MSLANPRLEDIENEIESAAGRVDIAAGTLTEAALTFEASEDRIVVAVQVKNAGNVTTELSFSATMLTQNQPVSDDISSGILAVSNSAGNQHQYWFGLHGPVWSAGEEIHLHVDNASANSHVFTPTIYYIPIGEFLRERLRNR